MKSETRCRLMWRMLLASGVVALLPIAGCVEDSAPAEGHPAEVLGISGEAAPERDFRLMHEISGEILVKFKRGVGRSQRDAALDRVAEKVDHLEDRNIGRGGRRGPGFFDQLVHLKLKPSVARDEAVEALRSDARVEYAEANGAVRAIQNVPNDPQFSRLWGLHNTGQTAGRADADIDAPEAWTLGTGSSQVVVAVIDTGVDYAHPDLTANMWMNSGEVPGNGLDDDGNGFVDDVHGYDFANNDGDPADDHFHGTHCAGTIGAVGNNGIGIAGVCWTVRIMALKFMGANGGGSIANAIKSIQYAVNNGAQILSNSWGGPGFSQSLQDAITAADGAGVLFVAAAGNDNTNATFSPACMDKVLTVAATDHKDVKAWFSNWGSNIDVAAPGVHIYSCGLGGSYREASGTSMACPHVAGLAALLKSRNATLTNAQLEMLIKSSSDDLGDPGWDPYFGYGRINAQRAMQAVQQGNIAFPTALISAPRSGEVLGGVVSITGTAAGQNFAGYTLDYSGADTPWTPIASSTTPVTNGQLGTLDASAFQDGTYSLRLTVADMTGLKFYAIVSARVDNLIAQFALPHAVPAKAGSVAITGSARAIAGSFSRFSLELGVGAAPTSWSSDRFTLAGGGTVPVESGVLGTFDPSGLDEFYTIRLTVYGSAGIDRATRLTYVDPFLKPGWPVVLGQFSNYALSPALADVDGQGGQEILFPAEGLGLRAFDPNGNALFALTRQPDATAGIQIQTTPCVADLSDAPGQEFAFGDFKWQRIFSHSGSTPMAGFPVRTGGSGVWPHYSTCVMAYDVDGDGRRDLVVPSTTDSLGSIGTVRLTAISASGVELPGFPFTYSYPMPAYAFRAAAVGDLDNDGKAEIFFTVLHFRDRNSPWGKGTYKATLFGVDHRGQLLPGFPIHFTGVNNDPSTHLGDLAIADVTGDGRKELIFNETSSRFAVHVLGKDGRELPGWPHSADYGVTPERGGNLAIGDVTGDARPEIVVYGTSSGMGGNWSFLTSPNAIVLNGDGTVAYTIGARHENEAGGVLYAKAAGFSLADIDDDGKAEILMVRDVYAGTDPGSMILPAVIAYKGTQPIFRLLAHPVSDPSLGKVSPSGHPFDRPVLGDIDRDGTLELIYGFGGWVDAFGQRTILYVWDLPHAYRPDALEWVSAQGNSACTGEYVPKGQRGSVASPADSTAPSCAIASPQNGGALRGSVTVEVSAADDTRVALVELLLDGALIGTGTAAPFRFPWSTSTASNGAHTLTAKAYDAAGNMALSAPVRVSVDNAAPACALLSPKNGAILNGTVTVAASASDNAGVARVEFLINGAVRASDSSSPFEFVWNTTAEPAGSYTLAARALDAAGNVGFVSIGVSVDQTARDGIAPSVSITAPAAGATVRGTITVSASASDNIGVAKVQFYRGGSSLGIDTTAPYSVTWDTTTVADGKYTLAAWAFDAAGNYTSTLATVTVSNVVDTTSPAVAIVSPASGNVYSAAQTIAISAAASDNVGVVRVEFYRNGSLVASDAVSPYSVAWSITSAENGPHSWTARAFDAAGNSATSDAVTLTVSIPLPDTAAPTCSISSPLAGATVSGTITVSASATDNVGVTRVEFRVDGVLKATDTASPYGCSLDTKTLSNGPHTIEARALDAAGNSATDSVALSVFNDGTAPACSIGSPLAGATVSGTITVSASATDNVGVTRVDFYRDSELLGSDTTAPYSLSWNTTTVANGSHTLQAKAFDAAGNAGASATITVNVNNVVADTTPPAAPTGLAASRARTKGSFVDTLRWNANTESDLAGYRVYRATSSGGTYALVGTISKTQTSVTLNVGKRPPTYYYILRAFDSSGNESRNSAVVSAF